MPKMHLDELQIDVDVVRHLLASQFPRWSKTPISRVLSSGTDNAIFKLGDNMCVRLPRTSGAAATLEKEQIWLERIAHDLTLSIPCPLGIGVADSVFPWVWSVYEWLEGEEATRYNLSNLEKEASQLGRFVTSLQRLNTIGGPVPGDPNGWRGAPLQRWDLVTRECISSLGNIIDGANTLRVWEVALDADLWLKPPVWVHGDLHSGNLLNTGGILSSVIDFGCLGIGDPCYDLLPAWELFHGRSRQVYRETIQADEATWLRGRGRAVSWAVIALPYYWDTNPSLVDRASRVLNQILTS